MSVSISKNPVYYWLPDDSIMSSPYYKIGYLSPRLFADKINEPAKPICYPDLSCDTKNFSMCRFPNTKWNAKVYYDRFMNCPAGSRDKAQCDKYLFKV